MVQFLRLYYLFPTIFALVACLPNERSDSTTDLNALTRKITKILEHVQKTNNQTEQQNSEQNEMGDNLSLLLLLEQLRQQKRELIKQLDRIDNKSHEQHASNGTKNNNSSETTKTDKEMEGNVAKYSFSPYSHLSEHQKYIEFFTFLILIAFFGTISCILRCYHKRKSTHELRTVNTFGTIFRVFSKVPEPFGPEKQFCLKFDEKGLCYASPLNSKDLLPLPSYEQACKLPTPEEMLKQKSNETKTVPNPTVVFRV